jgi:hypothetical protein
LAVWAGAAVIDLTGTWLAHPPPGAGLRCRVIRFDGEHMIERLRFFPPNRPWGELHYLPYWHYDALQALVVPHRAGHGDDPRTEWVRGLVRRRRRPDGRWRGGCQWGVR